MKKLTFLSLVFVLLAAVLSAAADSVWMPMDDYFMNTWDPSSSDTCTNVERKVFMAAGDNGYAVSIRTPADRTPLMAYPNGTEFVIDFFCGIGDDLWGTIRSVRLPGADKFTEDYMGQSGYISKKDLVQAFDTDAFSELYSNQIYAFDQSEYDPCAPHPFVIWSYPGSGVQLDVVDKGTLDWFCGTYEKEYFPITIDRIYTDGNGGRWLAVTLEKPYTRGWINWDAPMP